MLLTLALLLAAGPSSEPLEAVLSQVVRAYGGEKALSRIAVVRETGTLQSQRGLAETARLFAPPDRLRVEIRYPDGTGEVRLLAGPHSWRDNAPVQGPPRDAMLLQASRLDIPGVLLRNRGKLVDLGPVTREGKTLHWIGAPMEGNLQLAVGVDPKSGLVVRSEGQLPSPGGSVRFATDFSDFRSVSGVMFAFAETNWASGQKTGETRLSKIEVLDSASPGDFLPEK